MSHPKKRVFPTPEQLRDLPVQLTKTVPPEWEDRNGHVNVQFYLTLYELGGWNIFDPFGFDEEWFSQQNVSVFDLEHHLNYLAEIRIGDKVTTYHRVSGFSKKRFHGMYFIVNETAQRLAACVEYVAACVDMETRRTAEFPAELAQAMAKLLDEHQGLAWEMPLCGVIKP